MRKNWNSKEATLRELFIYNVFSLYVSNAYYKVSWSMLNT